MPSCSCNYSKLIKITVSTLKTTDVKEYNNISLHLKCALQSCLQKFLKALHFHSILCEGKLFVATCRGTEARLLVYAIGPSNHLLPITHTAFIQAAGVLPKDTATVCTCQNRDSNATLWVMQRHALQSAPPTHIKTLYNNYVLLNTINV